VVDSHSTERDILEVFSETLFGPRLFRSCKGEVEGEPDCCADCVDCDCGDSVDCSIDFDERDFDDSGGGLGGSKEQRPNFAKELAFFRRVEGKGAKKTEMKMKMLVGFLRFEKIDGGEGFERAVVLPQKGAAGKTRLEIWRRMGADGYLLFDFGKNGELTQRAEARARVEVPNYRLVDGFDNANHVECNKSDTDDDVTNVANTNDTSTTNDDEKKRSPATPVPRGPTPPTFDFSFTPPIFGLTTLGNSHGFDPSGSVSGYVLWINRMGIMIDPPPYASATLERAGILPSLIIGVIVTHCHADHDAGAFQRVLLNRKILLITTPTIYDSFLTKYAALSSLSRKQLSRSHRFRPAVVGRPLHLLGSKFEFFYSLHTIPCVGFKVTHRSKSIVFTADTLNDPQEVARLVSEGVCSVGRGEFLNSIAHLDCDLLLHETGVPPIHTPLRVLEALPDNIKERMYVVHTSALDPKCKLKVAPPGIAGTIRVTESKTENVKGMKGSEADSDPEPGFGHRSEAELADVRTKPARTCPETADAWFLINLLSALPFVESLDVGALMELVGVVRTEVVGRGEVVLTSGERGEVIAVVWEGRCMDADATALSASPYLSSATVPQFFGIGRHQSYYHPGDWTAPSPFQPEIRHTYSQSSPDLICCSSPGATILKVSVRDLTAVLQQSSSTYRQYKNRSSYDSAQLTVDDKYIPSRRIPSLLDMNSSLHNLYSSSKFHLETLVGGTISFEEGELMWNFGDVVENSYLIARGYAQIREGTVSQDETLHPREDSKWCKPFGEGALLIDASCIMDEDEERLGRHSSECKAGAGGCEVFWWGKCGMKTFLCRNQGVALCFLGRKGIG